MAWEGGYKQHMVYQLLEDECVLGTRTLFGNFFGNNRHLNYARIMRE